MLTLRSRPERASTCGKEVSFCSFELYRCHSKEKDDFYSIMIRRSWMIALDGLLYFCSILTSFSADETAPYLEI